MIGFDEIRSTASELMRETPDKRVSLATGSAKGLRSTALT
jgi:hypothetical protein